MLMAVPQELLATGKVDTSYEGPTPRMLQRWKKLGAEW